MWKFRVCRWMVAGMLLGAYSPVASAADTPKASDAPFTPLKTGIVRCGDEPMEISVDLNRADDLYLVVTYGGDSYDCDQAIWAEPTLTTADGAEIALSEVPMIDEQVGWGRLFVNKNQHGGKLSGTASDIQDSISRDQFGNYLLFDRHNVPATGFIDEPIVRSRTIFQNFHENIAEHYQRFPGSAFRVALGVNPELLNHKSLDGYHIYCLCFC